jgi:hypothetical protein
MKTVRVLLLTLSLLIALVVVVPAQAATTVDECQADIDALRTATLSATFIGQNAEKNQAGLVSKLDSASTKLAEGKNQDALAVLIQFRTKVETLNSQGKIAPADAETLIAGANEAIACVENLSAGT